MNNRLRVHDRVPASWANGPGCRAVIWLQGCTLNCPGCFNPQTHNPAGGQWIAVRELFEWVCEQSQTIEGLSISGGEPLQQRAPLLNLFRRIRDETSLSVLLFSGFSFDEIQRLPESDQLLALIDVLVAGRYRRDQAIDAPLRSSANQTLHLLSGRYRMKDLEKVPPGELIVTAQGQVILSGTAGLSWE